MARTINAQQGKRHGFTMIELLITVAIIAVLLSLSAAAAFRFMGTQPRANTMTLLNRFSSRLNAQQSTVLDKARGETPLSIANSMASGSIDRAKVIHAKCRLQQYFPTTFQEALSPSSGYPPVTGYVSYLATFGITSTTLNPSPVPSFESGACLFMILRHGPDTAGEDDLGLNASSQTITNPKTGTGIPVLVDGWGNPLVFCRWPIGGLGFVSPVNPNGAQQASNLSAAGTPIGMLDPVDPKGLLNVIGWPNSSGGNSFQLTVHPVPGRLNASINASSVNLAPVIVSAGPDGQLGLSIDPNDPNNFLSPLTILNQSQANDNLYSR